MQAALALQQEQNLKLRHHLEQERVYQNFLEEQRWWRETGGVSEFPDPGLGRGLLHCLSGPGCLRLAFCVLVS